MPVLPFPALPRQRGFALARLLAFASVLLAPGSLLFAAGEASSATLEPIAPIVAPFPMKQLARPVFPARVVSIRDHGAVDGGDTKNTEAFAKAIAACAAAGGGRVLVPAGKWLTGPIHLQSNIDLHLAEGAVIVFSDRFEDYLPNVLVRGGGVEFYNYSPLIYARGCTNVAITGPGRLDGNAKAWWPWAKKETKAAFEMGSKGVPVEQRVFGTPEAAIRPSFVVFWECKNVLWEGFTIGGGPNWTLHPIYCEDVIIRRVHVLTDGPNNDGIDPDSCRNMLIEHCVFDTGDDCVVLKSGYNEDGWRVARPMENLVMRWCSSKRGHGGLVVGSEMSGDVRNVYVHDCEFEGTDRAVRIKSKRGRGGVVENVWAERLRGKNLKYEAIILNMDYGADRNKVATEKPPVFRNFHFKDITCDGAPAAIRIAGLPDSPIQDLFFEDVTIRATKGVIANDVQNVKFLRTKIETSGGAPAFDLTDARQITLRETQAGKASEVLVKLSGVDSRAVRIEKSPVPLDEKAVVRGEGVATDAVVVVESSAKTSP